MRRSNGSTDDWYEPIVTRVDELIDQRTLAAHPDWHAVRAALIDLGVSPTSGGLHRAGEMPLDRTLLRARMDASTAKLLVDSIRTRDLRDAELMRLVLGEAASLSVS